MNILEFMDSDALTPGTFKGDSWAPWKAVYAAMYGLPLDKDQAKLFKRLAGGRKPPKERVRQAFIIAGRRAAKSHTTAGNAVYLATVGAELYGLLDKLSHGERGVIAVVAVDRAQAKVVLSYIRGLLESSPILAQMIQKQDSEAIHLTNRVSIEVGTNSHRSVRGRTLLAAILDECAFFRDDTSATPDVEVYRALVPGLATTGGMLIGISSPYSRKGLLFNQWRKHYGKNTDTLVIQAATTDLNPTIDRRVIEEAQADDPEAAKAEWFGQFRSDVSAFLPLEVVEAAVRPNRLELPPIEGVTYSAFVDPAGGGADEFCVAIGHREDDRLIVDVVRARKGTPADIVSEYASLLKDYRISRCQSDRYAGSWPKDEFKRHGITVEQSAKPKSELYLDALSTFNSGQVELPPDDRLIKQFANLERRTARGGRDSIDHAPGGHDDRANVVAGLMQATKAKNDFIFMWGDSPNDTPQTADSARGVAATDFDSARGSNPFSTDDLGIFFI